MFCIAVELLDGNETEILNICEIRGRCVCLAGDTLPQPFVSDRRFLQQYTIYHHSDFIHESARGVEESTTELQAPLGRTAEL